MAYVAPTTQSANSKLTSASWNQSVNNMIDVNARANQTIGLYIARPASATIGSLYYQTNTNELLKYVTDVDGSNKWMQISRTNRRNFVINGGFDVWQRGTSFNPTSATSTTGANYGADRWQFLQATTSTAAFTRQAITATDPAGYNYYTRVQRAAALTHVTGYALQSSFESQNIQNIRGKYVTLSFWARAGVNMSGGGVVSAEIITGTGTDNTVSNFTTNTTAGLLNAFLTTSWQRFTITTTAALATSITQLGVRFVFIPTGTAGAADYFDITGVQLEVGTAPSDFEFRDFGEELRRCQRYYYRTSVLSTDTNFGSGIITTTSTANILTQFPVTLRVAPTTVQQNGTVGNYSVKNLNTSTTCATTVPTFSTGSVDNATTTFTTAATLVAGQACQGTPAFISAYLAWSAEL
jgi:hypothetical protein